MLDEHAKARALTAAMDLIEVICFFSPRVSGTQPLTYQQVFKVAARRQMHNWTESMP